MMISATRTHPVRMVITAERRKSPTGRSFAMLSRPLRPVPITAMSLLAQQVSPVPPTPSNSAPLPALATRIVWLKAVQAVVSTLPAVIAEKQFLVHRSVANVLHLPLRRLADIAIIVKIATVSR